MLYGGNPLCGELFFKLRGFCIKVVIFFLHGKRGMWIEIRNFYKASYCRVCASQAVTISISPLCQALAFIFLKWKSLPMCLYYYPINAELSVVYHNPIHL